MAVVFGCLIFTLVLSVLYVVWRDWRWLHMYWSIPGDVWSIPGLGYGFKWLRSSEGRMEVLMRYGRMSNKNGGLTSLWLGPRYFLVVSDPVASEIFLKKSLAKGKVFNIAKAFLGDGSLFAPVHIWRPRRKISAPTFSVKNLNRFVDIFNRQSSIMVEQLQAEEGKGAFSVWTYISSYAMDSVCESTLGVEMNAQRRSDNPFLRAFEQHCHDAVEVLMLPPFAQDLFSRLPAFNAYLKPIHVMWEFVDNIIKNKRKELTELEEKQQCEEVPEAAPELVSGRAPASFLELMLRAGRAGAGAGYGGRGLREELLVQVLAGTDTSALGATFTALMLAAHPAVQERAALEIKEVLGGSDRPITSADLPHLKYLEAVIKESLRLYPPVPTIIRQVEEDTQLPSGKTILKDTDLMISIWATHRHPQYWGEDAELFRPERFLESGPSHPAAFIPFSYGPRGCIGYQYALMSLKTVLSNLLRRYRLRPARPASDPHEPLRLRYDIIMRHIDNFEIKIEARV